MSIRRILTGIGCSLCCVVIFTTVLEAASACDADISGDGFVDIVDYSALTRDFFSSSPSNTRSDITKDGSVDVSDYTALVRFFLQSAACPSPSTGTTSSLGPNLLSNGGFENGSVTGWETVGKVSSTEKHDGNSGLHFSNTYGGDQRARQGWIAVTPGKTYVLTGWFLWKQWSGGGWGSPVARVTNDGWTTAKEIYALHELYPQNTWSKFAVTFTATKPRVLIELGSSGPKQTVDMAFDTISLQEKTGNAAPTIAPVADKISGSTPLSVSFQAKAADSDGAIETYRWEFSDGGESRQENPTYVFHSGGKKTVRLTVFDNDGATTTRTLVITPTNASEPTLEITTAPATTTADSIMLTGTAVAKSGTLQSLIIDNTSNGETQNVTVTGTNTGWSAQRLLLKPGENDVLLSLTDTQNNVTSKRVLITRTIDRPVMNDIRILTPSPKVHEKFELSFSLLTTAKYPLFSYEENPPPGVEPRSGVSVHAVITTPTGKILTQPAFYAHETKRVGSTIIQEPEVVWKMRYSPMETGIHTIQLKARDSSGETTIDAGTFTAFPSTRRGFISVSKQDPRYFEFSSGDLYFPTGPTLDTVKNESLNNGRPWMGGRGAYSSRWARWWSTAEDWGNEGADTYVCFTQHYPGSELSYWLSAGKAFRYWLGWIDDTPELLLPDTTYQVKLRAKTIGITGPGPLPGAYGLTLKVHGYWSHGDTIIPPDVRNSPSWFPPITGTRDWSTVVARFTTSPILPHQAGFSLLLENVTAGEAFIDELSVREVRSDGSLGGEIIRNNKADHHTYVEQRPMALFDEQVTASERMNQFLRYVVHDKNDWIQNSLTTNGVFAEKGNGYYQEKNTKAHWLLAQWWRYVGSRLGYSTAVFAWELNNEGPPDDGSGMHAKVTQEFAQSIQRSSANPHLATTSFWCCWRPTFWKDTVRFPNVSYADIHTYGTPTDMVEWYLADALPAYNDKVGKPVVRSETGIQDQFYALLEQPNPGVWFHTMLWSQLHPSSMYEIGYWHSSHLKAIPVEKIATNFYSFVKTLDLNKGGYEDISATVSNSAVRVFGQKNTASGKAHAWIQNKQFTWKNVADGVSIPGQQSGVRIGMGLSGSYAVSWYNTHSGQVEKTEVVNSDGSGEISLQTRALTDDIAVKITRQ